MRQRYCYPAVLSVLLALLFVPFLQAQPPQKTPSEVVGISSLRLERLNAFFDDYVSSGKLPGGVLMVSRGDGIVYDRAFELGLFVQDDIGRRMQPGSPGEFGWGGAYHSTYWADPSDNLVLAYFSQVLPATGLDDHAKTRVLIYQAIQD